MGSATLRSSSNARALLVAALLGCGSFGYAKHAARPMSYEAAIERLRSHETWCEGAEALGKLGNRRAVVPIVLAYETPIEGASKQCLLRALELLAPEAVIAELFNHGVAQGDAEGRRAAVHLMELFAADAHLERLERAAADSGGEGSPSGAARDREPAPDPGVGGAARAAARLGRRGGAGARHREPGPGHQRIGAPRAPGTIDQGAERRPACAD